MGELRSAGVGGVVGGCQGSAGVVSAQAAVVKMASPRRSVSVRVYIGSDPGSGRSRVAHRGGSVFGWGAVNSAGAGSCSDLAPPRREAAGAAQIVTRAGRAGPRGPRDPTRLKKVFDPTGAVQKIQIVTSWTCWWSQGYQ